MMKTVYHMRSCIENTVQLRNAVFFCALMRRKQVYDEFKSFFVYDKKTYCIRCVLSLLYDEKVVERNTGLIAMLSNPKLNMAIHHLHQFLHQTSFLPSRNRWKWCKEVEYKPIYRR